MKALMLVVCVAQFMVILDVAIVNIALPSIHHALHFSSTGLQWIVSAYTLTFAGFLMLGGRACDVLGSKRVFLVGTVLFATASAACALAESKTMLVGARALQGLGGAAVSPASLAILTSSFEEGHARNRALGAWAAMAGLGGSFGMVLGGLLTQGFGWRAIFLINVPIELAVVIFGRGIIPARDEVEEHQTFDVAGAILITAGLTTIVYGIVRSEALGWAAPGVLLPLAAGSVLLAVFGIVEDKLASDPLLPLRVFRMPLLRAANFVVILLFCGMFSVWLFLSLYLQQVCGFGALETGIAFLPMTLSVFVSSTLAARAVRRFGARPVLTGGMLGTAAGLALLSGVPSTSSYAAHVLPGGMVASVGLGFALVAATILAMQGMPGGETGLASGILNTSRFVGATLGVAGFSTLAASRSHAEMAAGIAAHSALTAGYQTAFLAGTVTSFLGAIAALTLIKTVPRVLAQPG